MKTVILAGGLGTRLAEETDLIPKPMVEIGGQPILWHIMRHYSHYGFKEFVLPLGYKGSVVKRFFLDMPTVASSFSIDTTDGRHLDPQRQPVPELEGSPRGHRSRHGNGRTDPAGAPAHR